MYGRFLFTALSIPVVIGVNVHQFTLNKKLLLPLNIIYRSCVPVAPSTEQDFVTQVCHPPVTGTVHVPFSFPVLLSRRSSIVPPLPAEATLASKALAPSPKSRVLTFIQSPFSIFATLSLPLTSLVASVPTPDCSDQSSASNLT